MSWFIESIESGDFVVNHKNKRDQFRLAFDNYAEAEAACNKLNGGDGLTKRERFAMAAMTGCIDHGMSDHDVKGVSRNAVAQADALIAALDEVES